MAQAPHAPPPGAIQAVLAGQGPPVPAAPQQAVQQAAGQGPQAAGQGPQAAGQGLQAAQAPQAAGQGPQAAPQHAAAPPAPLQPVGQGQGAGAPIVQQGQVVSFTILLVTSWSLFVRSEWGRANKESGEGVLFYL